MSNENPMVSIVIPVYNGSNYLKEAIDSALDQDYENTEVIVVNDGSNDGGTTEAIALSYGDKIRYFSKENGGVATALNYAIDQMRGDYFSWLSHDDLYMPNKISAQIEALRECGDMTRLVYSDYVVFTDDGDTLTTWLKYYPRKVLTSSVSPINKTLVHGCSILIHKSHFERVGRFNPAFPTEQDYDLWFRMFLGQDIVYVDKQLVKSRKHMQQGSLTNPEFKERCVNLNKGFADRITKEEMDKLPGGAYKCLYEIMTNLVSFEDIDALRYVNNKFMDIDIPEETTPELRKFSNYISSLSDGRASRIAIFCAGKIGVNFYYKMKNRLVRIDTFADNNPQKHGYLFDGISCVSKEKLKEQKDDTLVIVAVMNPDELASQLRDEGFPYVVTHYDLIGVVEETMPLKWMSGLDFIEGVDYSSKNSQLLITSFNKLIYDICKYYEDKLYTVKESVDK